MPTCRTCYGEYQKKQSSCPRCESDVDVWKTAELSLPEYILYTIIGLGPSLVMALIIWRAASLQPNSLHHFIAGLLAVGLPILAFFSIFGQRHKIRELTWAQQVYKPRFRLHPALIGILALLATIVLWLVSYVLFKVWGDPKVIKYYHKLIFALVYSLGHLCFTASATLLVLQRYLKTLDESVPPPLFVNTDRMVQVAVKTAFKILGTNVKSEGLQDLRADQKVTRRLEVMQTSRRDDDGGVRISVREYRGTRLEGDDFFGHPQWIENTWIIEADRWARIQSLKPSEVKYSQ